MPKARVLVGTALLSAGSLLLEVASTRVLSVLYVQSYVFLLLSVAVLGIGLGAALATLLPSLRREATLPLGSSLSALSAFALCVLLAITMGSPLWLIFTFALLPYVFVGLTLATLFSLRSQESPGLYWADLSGAGVGVVIAVPLIDTFGGLNASFIAAGLLSASTFLFFKRTHTSLGLSGLLVLSVMGQLAFSPFTLELRNLNTPKPILEHLRQGGEILETRWDAFARTDLVYRADQEAYYLYMDGGAGSLVPDATKPERWEGDIGSFPFVADAPASAFIVGPGGGLDVALALRGGVTDMTVVEVNGPSIELVRDLASYAGEVYGANVDVVSDEGRSVLRRSERDYDLIFLSQVVTQAAEARGYGLAENTLYTTEAFHDYLTHLTPEGQIVLKLYDELTLTRALLTAVQTLSETGLSESEAAGHMLALLDTSANPPIPLLIVKKRALNLEEAVRLARVAEARNYALLFVPDLIVNPPLDGLLSGKTSVDAIISEATSVDLRPVTDNRPFFYTFERGLPRALRPLVIGLVVITFLSGLVYLLTWRSLRPSLKISPLLFAALGFGFMLLEITLIQRTQLLLGHPTLTLSLVLGTLLLGGGTGSALAGRVFERPVWGVFVVSSLTVLFWLLWNVTWPFLSAALLRQGVGVRATMIALSLVPLALVLGMPFPLLLCQVGKWSERQVALGWAVNGFMSVVGERCSDGPGAFIRVSKCQCCWSSGILIRLGAQFWTPSAAT